MTPMSFSIPVDIGEKTTELRRRRREAHRRHRHKYQKPSQMPAPEKKIETTLIFRTPSV